MSLDHALEQFRYALFIGELPKDDFSPLTQEQYIELYEQQIERDPAMERKLMVTLSAPILSPYRKQMEQLARMENMIAGEERIIACSDDEVLEELYDEVSNMETDEEWQQFKSRLLS
ncbi:hypothetical protein [Ammoniphilus sp. YIM 78166]|uniref:hypothetical protein n=1 Tax=Ammoniphilus sp. YIM 78166 TaxID=1644106 RepID=UPI0010706718|nr:hypothetical protein [Ammoniphilus sp. YIM 78166]